MKRRQCYWCSLEVNVFLDFAIVWPRLSALAAFRDREIIHAGLSVDAIGVG